MIILALHRVLLFFMIIPILLLISFSLKFFPILAPLHHMSLEQAFYHFFNDLLQWDFGVSKTNGQSIKDQIAVIFPATMELCFLAFLLALFLGVPLGITAGITKGRWPDTVISFLAFIGFSIPVFVLALLFILFFSLHLNWLPSFGHFSTLNHIQQVTGLSLIDSWFSTTNRKEHMINTLKHLILPVTVLAIPSCTEVIRLLRISTYHVMNQNYIKAAATRGLSLLTMIFYHILPNALPPIMTKLGWQFSTMLSLAMIIEVIFDCPGLGSWLINALTDKDYAVLSAAVTAIGSAVLIIHLIADLLGILMAPPQKKEWYALR